MKSKAVPDLLRAGDPTAPAIGAPDRKTMMRAELLRPVAKTGGSLRNLGIQQNHAVAMVMPNGPEMAAAFVAVASWATAAPLNAGYRADEFDFYLGDLDAKALIIQGGSDSPARALGHFKLDPAGRQRLEDLHPDARLRPNGACRRGTASHQGKKI